MVPRLGALALPLLLLVLAAACSSDSLPKPKLSPAPADDYAIVDPRALDADYGRYVGKLVLITGEVLGVQHGDGVTWAQIMAEVPNQTVRTQSLIVYLYPEEPNMLRGDRYKIYAEVAGREEVTLRSTGAKVKETVLVAHTAYPSSQK